MNFIRWRRNNADLQERIEKEIRERVIRRERELREEREQRLWEQSTIQALQEITELIPDSEVEDIAHEIHEKWERKGSLLENEDRIEKEIREKVIRREKELGKLKEKKQREQSHLEALRQVTDYVSDEEIELISKEVHQSFDPQEKVTGKRSSKTGKIRTGSKKKKELSKESSRQLLIGNSLVALLLVLLSISYWNNPEDLYPYIYWILPVVVIIAGGIVFNMNLWHWLIIYPFWGLIYVFVILWFVKPAIMDSQVWTDYDAAENLIYPITEGDVDRVTTMVENGAKINVRRAYGYTPLMIAASRGEMEIVQILVHHGANLNPRDRNDKKTALVMAYTNGHYDVADYLINQGAWINLEDIRGQTLLFHAIDSLPIFRSLVESGADLGRKDYWGRDILSHAVFHNKADIVRYLRHQGMEFRRITRNRQIPGITEAMIFQALECPQFNHLAYYLAVEGDIEDLKDLDKAATEACHCDMEEVLQILVDLGARIECEP